MPTRNVNLTSHQDQQVADYIASGRYKNASEVIREGLRLMESRDAEEVAKLDALRAAVDAGIEDIDRGAYKDFANGAELAGYLKSLRAGVR